MVYVDVALVLFAPCLIECVELESILLLVGLWALALYLGLLLLLLDQQSWIVVDLNSRTIKLDAAS